MSKNLYKSGGVRFPGNKSMYMMRGTDFEFIEYYLT